MKRSSRLVRVPLLLIAFTAFATVARPQTHASETIGSGSFYEPYAPSLWKGDLVQYAAKEQTEDASSNWERVRQLAAHTEIVVAIRAQPAVRAYFVAADDSELRVIVPRRSGLNRIARSDVDRISVLGKRPVRHAASKGAAIGFLMGLGLGAASYIVACRSNSCDSQGGLPLLLFPGWGFLLGGGIGAIAGGEKPSVVVYTDPALAREAGAQAPPPSAGSGAADPLLWRNARPYLDFAVSFTSVHLNSAAPDLYRSDTALAPQLRSAFYWNRHLKTEFEWTGGTLPGKSTLHYIDTPARLNMVDINHWQNLNRVLLSQLYQFRVSGMWRPYVGVGIGADTETLRYTANYYAGPPLTASQRAEYLQSGTKLEPLNADAVAPHVTTTTVRGFVTAGFKMYWTERRGMFWLVEMGASTGSQRLAPFMVGIGGDLF